MDYRIGKCSQCGAEYKIPASFAHDRARCKQCQGVVNIAPSGAAPAKPPAAPAPAAIPARKVVPGPAAEAPRPATPPPAVSRPEKKPDPDGMTKDGPRKGGTLERLKAERRAAAAAAAAAEKKPATPKPPAPPAAPSKPAPTRPSPARASSGTRPSPRRGKGEEQEEKPTRAGRAGAGGRRGSRSGGREKKTPVAGLVSVIALVVVGTGVYLFRDSLFGSEEPEVAAAGEETVASTPVDSAPVEESVPDPEPEPEPEVAETSEPEPEAPKAPKSRDPSSIDLAAMPALGKTPDTTDEEWATMQDQVAQWMDRAAGAAANRAKIALMAQGRKAVPAILNFFKTLDFATEDGRGNGDQCQKALQEICNGTNFDWKYADPAGGRDFDDPDDVWFCKRVVELWVTSWKQGEENIEAWIRMAKLDTKDPEEAARLRAEFGAKTATGESAEPVVEASDDDLEVD
jgi:hypothetical protein